MMIVMAATDPKKKLTQRQQKATNATGTNKK